MKTIDTENSPFNSATICRRNKWIVGTILEGDEGYGPERIVITAIGERCVLAQKISRDGENETNWTLRLREWNEVPQ